MDAKKRFGLVLKKLREEAGLTQKELADLAGVNQRAAIKVLPSDQ